MQTGFSNQVWRCVALLSALTMPVAVTAQIRQTPDAKVERCLSKGKIVGRKELLVGITGSHRRFLECDGKRVSALFKTVEEHQPGAALITQRSKELNLTDNYRYERAAYLLDRELGLDMVPVSVIRKIRGRRGALMAWIDGASHEMDLLRQPSDVKMAEITWQKNSMLIFDALILNEDRRPENWLLDHETWKLYLIDHSRSFRVNTDLPEDLISQPVHPTVELFQALQELNEPRLGELLKGLTTPAQIEAILKRRDLIVEKIERDLELYGERVIFAPSRKP